MSNLNPQKALIFRIVHVDNVPWILDNGLHCRNGVAANPNYREIGNSDLISKRHHHVVPVPPGGMLSDYIPFYFTPYSIMLYNIHTGRGVPKLPNEQIVILVSSLHELDKRGIPFAFTNGHAYTMTTQYFNDLAQLDRIDWDILQRRDFKRDLEDPEKTVRYQAEALVYRQMPVDALLGMACHNENVRSRLAEELEKRKIRLRLLAQPSWYFTP